VPSETPRFAVEIDEQGLPLDDLDCLELGDDEVLEEEEMSGFAGQSFSKSSSSSLSRISGFWTPRSWCTFSNLSSHFNSFNYFNNCNPSNHHNPNLINP